MSKIIRSFECGCVTLEGGRRILCPSCAVGKKGAEDFISDRLREDYNTILIAAKNICYRIKVAKTGRHSFDEFLEKGGCEELNRIIEEVARR